MAIDKKIALCQCPLGLIPHFYTFVELTIKSRLSSACQCPLGLIPHFYDDRKAILSYWDWVCQCPLGLIPHFYEDKDLPNGFKMHRVNALSGLYLISTLSWVLISMITETIVSMPSRAYTSFLHKCKSLPRRSWLRCVNALSGLYLISTLWQDKWSEKDVDCVNALSGLYLISTVPLQKPRFYAVSRTCFCRYLSEYSDNSRFSCMLTIWTYLMRCTYPWHWI